MLNRFLILPPITTVIWIGILLYSTYSNGHTVFTGTITETSFWNKDLRNLTLSATLVAVCSSTLLYICRIIQIQVILQEREQYTGCWKWCVRCYWTSLMICSFFLCAAVIQLSGAFHTVAVGLGCLFLLFLNCLVLVFNFKEKYILYKKTGKMYVVDTVIGVIMYVLVALSFVIWQISFHTTDCDYDGESCTLSAVPNFLEWFAFILTALGIWIVYIAFYYDPKLYLQLRRWWTVNGSADNN